MKTKTVYVVQYRDKWSGFLWANCPLEFKTVEEATKEMQEYADDFPGGNLRIIKRTEEVVG